ncbi:MAG: CTP synthase, partial [bacterium]
YQHGEVFVTDDGAETDLDLGHYERFMDVPLREDNSITTGKVYQSVIEKERRGDYLGACVQIIPHLTDEIKDRLHRVAQTSHADVVLVEVGGTVGDIEGLPYLEAIRQFRNQVGRTNCVNVHLTLVPTVGPDGELKSKLTQHSVKELREIGILADVILLRTRRPISKEMKRKISLFCDVAERHIIVAQDSAHLYAVPLDLEREGLAAAVLELLGLENIEPDLTDWKTIDTEVTNPRHTIHIALVGKYTQLKDAYISVLESLRHAGIANHADVITELVHSEAIESEGCEHFLGHVDGILVPGGFGDRGTRGKMEAVRYAREHGIPYLGLCLGMQLAVLEFARNVCGLPDADSTEFNPMTKEAVIDLMPDQKKLVLKGGTMRLGQYPCHLLEGTLAHRCYGADEINERHRHRYEVNNAYRELLSSHGMVFSGQSPDGQLVELIELPSHPFFIACQFHPEFLSRPTRPHPLFREFIGAAIAGPRPPAAKIAAPSRTEAAE